MLKRLLRHHITQVILCWLGAQYIRLVWATGTWTVENADSPNQLWAENKPFIYAFWHGHLLMMPMPWQRGCPLNMLISHHRDGQIISKTVRHLSISTISGSTKKSGQSAVRNLLRSLGQRECIGITPDGPRGPRMRVGGGMIDIARLGRVPIIPCAVAYRHRKILGTWDRFQIPLPFTRGVFVWGDPITISPEVKGDALDKKRRDVEDAMNTLVMAAERHVGRTAPDLASVYPEILSSEPSSSKVPS